MGVTERRFGSLIAYLLTLLSIFSGEHVNVSAPAGWASLSTRKAFAIHLALSILIFSSLVFVMLMWWFPGELFFLDGGWQGLKIVALIDLVLGPVLTLLLYKPGKKGLLLDVSCIALFQLAALGYGFYTTYQQRTVAVVFADRNFTTLSADAAIVAKQELAKLDEKAQPIRSLDTAFPAMLLTPEPEKGEFGSYMSQLFNGYPEPHERLDLFVKRGPEHAQMLSERAATQEKLATTGADQIVADAIKDGNFDIDDIEVHYFKARYSKGLVLFSKSEQAIVDYVPIAWSELIAKKAAELEQETKNDGASAITDESASVDDAVVSDTTENGKTDEAKPAVVAESLEQ